MNGRIVVNPDVFNDKRDAKGVAWNEGLRAWMELNGVELNAEPTDEQRDFFKGTAYERDEVQLRRTVAARIITHDSSAGGATQQQLDECTELLRRIRLSKGLTQEDRDVVTVLLRNLPGPSDAKPVAAADVKTEGRPEARESEVDVGDARDAEPASEAVGPVDGAANTEKPVEPPEAGKTQKPVVTD